MARRISVEIVGDDRQLARTFRHAAKEGVVFNTQIDRLSRGALAGSGAFAGFGRSIAFASTGFLSGAGFVAGAKASIDAASNLTEQIAKSRQVFKQSSGAIEDWSKTTAAGMGIARDRAIEATGTFGNLFRTVNIQTAQAAEMSQALVTLAADLASFNNASPEDALDALRSGLIGEAEPLRRFGVLLSEARVQQVAMAETGKRSAKELTNQEKALARYSIILKDTAPAQGDFARTSEGFANQSRKLKAEVRDLSAALGNVLLPALTDVVSGLNDGITAARRFGDELGKIPGGERIRRTFGQNFASAFAEGFLPGITYAKRFTKFVNEATVAVGDLRDSMRDLRSPDVRDIAGDLRRQFAKGDIEGRTPVDTTRTGGLNLTATQRNQFFDARISRQRDRVQDADLREQIRRLDAISKLISARIAVTKDITRKLNLEDELLDIRRERKSILQQIADNARADADAARQAAADARAAIRDAGQALIDALQFGLTKAQVTASFADDLAALDAINAALRKRIAAEGKTLDLQQQLFENQQQIAATRSSQATARQFKALGLSATGGEKIPGVAALRKQLGSLSSAVEGTFLDTNKTKSLLAGIRRVLSGGLGKVKDDVRSTIRDMLRDINQQLKDSAQERTKFRGLDTKAFLVGLGLDPDQIRALRGRLSQIGPGGTVPTRGQGAFGIGFSTQPIVVHTTVQLDREKVGTSLTRVQQRTARRTAAQRGGRNSGQGLGLG